ncbi:formamidopyrimidine-DNA glycosylase isoform X2 [Iris pallida]|uniref:Formamidopyrimidine-DNA glycosylase isoform X2 n=1 Tax=Iris pallida TaxID=29817 RepID=A0AAX6EVA7_IRIPA|nr:formamidopyrimidine-DNA glycosylase isoform X2 [Iris pallida]
MPELPEVEAARRAIEENCIGKSIRKCVVAEDPKVIDGVPRSLFESSLVGKTIVASLRKGKNLWLQLDSPPFPSFQFGMAGAIYIKGVAVTEYKRSAVSATDEWPSKYSKVFIELEDGLEFSFTDKRRFAKVRLLQDPKAVPPISELGPDALLEPMKLDQFVDSLGKKKIAIKALLLDQSYISGIGNWIADEVLYQARIHPLQVAASLSKENCGSLHRCIKEVIQYAVEVDADSSRFPIDWLFHFRWGKKSGKVSGKKIEFITAGGRTSAFVPELQKLNGPKTEQKPRQSKPRKRRSDGDSNDEKGDDTEEEEYNGNPKGKNAAGGTKRGQKNASRSDSNHDEGQPEKATRKRMKVSEDSSKKGSKSSKGNAQQKKKK